MIVAFDLDDTLYRELDFVESGFRAVASHVAEEFGIHSNAAYAVMRHSLEEHGRGRQFDDLLHHLGAFTVKRRNKLVQVYRRHTPRLHLPDASRSTLDALGTSHQLFLVTDGNTIVQANKVTALDLWQRFEHVYLTSRYGRAATKPSTKVFELMLRRTGNTPDQLVYIGDNPAKDFIGVRQLGGHTIRVLTGPYATVRASSEFDADHHVATIDRVVELIPNI